MSGAQGLLPPSWPNLAKIHLEYAHRGPMHMWVFRIADLISNASHTVLRQKWKTCVW